MIEQHIIASVAADLQRTARELQRKGMSAEEYWGELARIAIAKYQAIGMSERT